MRKPSRQTLTGNDDAEQGQIALGIDHACALPRNASLTCWGRFHLPVSPSLCPTLFVSPPCFARNASYLLGLDLTLDLT